MPLNKCKKVFFILCFLVLVTRLVFFAVLENDPQRFIEPDSTGYLIPAQSLLIKSEFSQNISEPSIPETMRVPGYPFWLSIIFSISDFNINAVVISQIFLFILTLFITFRLGTELFDPKVGLVAAILLAFDPYSFSHNFKIITETLATSLTLLLAYSMTFFFKNRGGYLNALAVGIVLTLVTFVRPTTYYFLLPLLVIVGLYLYFEKEKFKSIVIKIVLIALPFILAIGSWQFRNYNISGISYFTTLQGGEVMLTTKGAQILAAKEGLSPWEARYKVKEDLHKKYPEINSMSLIDRDNFYSRETMKMIARHPWLTIKTHINKLFIYFFAPGTTSELFRLFTPSFDVVEFNWHQKGKYLKSMLRNNPFFIISAFFGLLYISTMYAFLLYGLFGFSSITNPKNLFWVHLSLVFLIIYIANLGSLAGDQGRYRVVIMPLLSIYSAAGLVKFFTARTNFKKKGSAN